jgi:hypothetical protein
MRAWIRGRWLEKAGLAVLLAACSSTQASPSLPARESFPRIDCRIPGDECAVAVSEAASLLRDEAMGPGSRMVAQRGRSPGPFHAEVHTCLEDGRYLLIDVFGRVGEPPSVTLREDPGADPQCP